ncbi:helix-turn-helix domain-containing protein [Paucibacter sp. R3-3]|uniref:Helix-turn-helix domain-containing protein n=1 Tax=Roseateles agri TaxID=3098619 RepID=A0ABU5DG07_9BURK|nr:helix-turn-helix domain-containing protein [Paucibacter sp. R3-3]MDY0745217.1 helix-turn-helix domain-containing protein [Paucibacter sp. R3-3]
MSAAAAAALPALVPDAPMAARRMAAREIDEHTEHLADWDLRYDQLDCGAFRGEFTDIRWPGMQLFVETTTRRLRQRGALPPDSFGLGMLCSGDGELLANGKRSGLGSLMAVHSTELDFCSPANCTLAGFVLDSTAAPDLLDCVPELAKTLRGAVTVVANTPETALAPLRRMLLSIAETALQQPEALQDDATQRRIRDDLLLMALDALAGAQVSDRVARADTRKAVVDRACAFMLDAQDNPPTLLEVCGQLATSPRKLGYCFQDVLGISPARYIKIIRLNAVRRELRQAAGTDTSVYDVAARWGFWHFGHFSADYKRQFAELPSQTLKGSRG